CSCPLGVLQRPLRAVGCVCDVDAGGDESVAHGVGGGPVLLGTGGGASFEFCVDQDVEGRHGAVACRRPFCPLFVLRVHAQHRGHGADTGGDRRGVVVPSLGEGGVARPDGVVDLGEGAGHGDVIVHG